MKNGVILIVVLAVATAAILVRRVSNSFLRQPTSSPTIAPRDTARTSEDAAVFGPANELAESRLSTRPPKTAAEPSVSLPPVDAPLARAYVALKTLALAGNVTAASRLFRETRECYTANATVAAYENDRREGKLPGQDAHALASLSVDDQRIALERAASRETALASAREHDEKCRGTRLDIANVHADALPAALLGDADAAACYVQGASYPPPEIVDTAYLDTYRRNALQLMQHGMEHGDWRMVELLANAHANSRGMLGFLDLDDQEQGYRYLVLLSLGAGDDRIGEINRKLAMVGESLPEADRRKASTWARENFEKNFASSGKLGKASGICEHML